jgi:uncharacterized membrane-anchored protein YitT (DUF2179 family)
VRQIRSRSVTYFSRDNYRIKYNIYPYRWSIILGSLAYVLYIAANIHPMLVTHIIAGALNGLGAAIIWTAQGVR